MVVYAVWEFIDTFEYSGSDELLIGLVRTREQASKTLDNWVKYTLNRMKTNGDNIEDYRTRTLLPDPDDPNKDGKTIEIQNVKNGCDCMMIRYEAIEVFDREFFTNSLGYNENL